MSLESQTINTKLQVLAGLTTTLAKQLGMGPEEVDAHRSFLELGADSVVFVEVVHWVERNYGVAIAPHQLFEGLVDLDALAEYVACHATLAPPSLAPGNGSEVDVPHQEGFTKPAGVDAGVEALVHQQLDLMAAQLRLLGVSGILPKAQDAGRAVTVRARPTTSSSAPAPSSSPLTEAQRRYLDEFTIRYNARTQGSKAQAQRHRSSFVDRRAAVGFAPETKELLYPIVGASSNGARIWDIDGNEYIDVSMGFGVHLFGHQPPFVKEALAAQLEAGVQIGPQSKEAGELAEKICRLSSMDRVAFCNSGTEAVMTAIRVARAATGRDRLVMFKGSYHGHSDATLALSRRVDDRVESMPMVPGVPQAIADQVVVLDYDDPRSLDYIEAHGHQLAAVVVEPIQSRRPELQPVEFVRRLRELTRDSGTALIFDEVITGFRVALGGAQAMFGVDADLATYGKLLGGGLPIGVVAGRRDYMDRIDGGAWRFGDASTPRTDTTFFAGTFSKHPLTVAAALAVLREIEAAGDELYRDLERKTARLVSGLNALFESERVELRAVHCGSIFRIATTGPASRISYLHEPIELRVFYHHMIAAGVYFWEGRTGFMSTAHTGADIDKVVAAARESVAAMRSGGFFELASEAHTVLGAGLRYAPLSPAQEGLWLQSALEDGSGTFNLPGGVRVRGSLEPQLVERAVVEILRRHDSLRTRFETVDGTPRQVITPAEKFGFGVEVIDWRDRDPNQQTTALREHVDAEARRPFALEFGPLVRVRLIHMDQDDWVLLVTMHHLVGDGWSFAVFVHEFSALYEAYAKGQPSPLRPLPVQYADYAIEQRSEAHADKIERQLDYWMEQLADAPTQLALPTDRPRRSAAEPHSVTLTRGLERVLVERVRQVARTNKVTLHMTLLSAFALLLHRHSDQDEVLIGAPVLTRDRAQLRDLIGLFINTVVFRVGIDEQLTFAHQLAEVRRLTLEAYAHRDVPFRDVVRAVQPERSPNRHPLFQAWFNLDLNVEATALELGELAIEPLSELVDTPTQLDLSLYVREDGDQLVIKWIYNEELFDRSTIENLAEQFEFVLEQLADDPGQKLDQVSLATPRAMAMLPDPATGLGRRRYPAVTELFERWVRDTPSSIALTQASRTWTYAELGAAMREGARRLEAIADVGDAVAVTGQPSFGLVATVLAILASRRVLVTIDPELPAQRKTTMMVEANVSCLLQVGGGEPESSSIAAIDRPVSEVSIDEFGAWGDVVDRSRNTPPRAHGEDRDGGPAYVFFTSGTTGTPKGVLGTHDGVAHFVEWQRRCFGVLPGERVAQATRLGFDAILRDIFLPLVSGATLCLPSPSDLLDPVATLRWLERDQVTVLHTVPTLGELWVSSAHDDQRLPDLGLLFFAGEPLKAELVDAWRELAPRAEIVNFYGPTETTMIKSYHRVPVVPRPGVQLVGQPLPDGQILVLAGNNRLCGLGELGEIVLRTPYRTRGYINAAAEQTRRFVVNPFSGEANDLLYKTGDLGRVRLDGRLEILGRLDRQIKIRGVRIELGEIESVLVSHPEVERASAEIVDDERGRRVLAFVTRHNPALGPEQIISFLREHLAAASVPARVVIVDELPMLANGKVDGGALLELADQTPRHEPAVPPSTPTEQLVASYAAELLDCASLGVHDDFFELGGHSLLAAQLVARLRRSLRVSLSLRALFETPTVAGLSTYIDEQQGAKARALALTLQTPEPGDEPLEETFEL